MQAVKFSKYRNVEDKNKVDISIVDYIELIKNNPQQSLVFEIRAKKANNEDTKFLKSKLECITGSAVMNQGSKVKSNIHELNGLIVIDIDDEVDFEALTKIKNDKYTLIAHRSVSGKGVCIFVKINPKKFLESFNDLGQYYWDNFNLTIDPSCKNENRLRYISYDTDIFYNEKALKFTSKTKIEKPKTKESFIFVQDDFSILIDKLSNIDLCQDDYSRYCTIGFAIGSKFGVSGLDYFKAICQNGSKYNAKDVEKHYKHFCKDGGITIASLYHLAKQEGIEIYSDKTKKIIQRTQVMKSQAVGTTADKIVEVLQTYDKIDNVDLNLVAEVLKLKTQIKFEDEENEIVKLRNFILENYNPKLNTLTNDLYINDEVLEDNKLNSIYLTAKILLQKVTKSDVFDIINSETTPRINPVTDFFNDKNYEAGIIQQYIDCIEPQNDYNRWAFKKWIVGAVHNWISPVKETKVSPLTLVLCGVKQGTGKTSFFRNLLPNELQEYLIETKIDGKDKDSLISLAKGLIVLDDEFGGLAMKDVKDFKKVADTNEMSIRTAYARTSKKFKRRGALCGTSNDTHVLKDVTGNRRILPIQVEKIDYNKMITLDTDSLWREAIQLHRSGFDWKIYTSEDINYLNQSTINNIEVMPVEELFFNRFSLDLNDVFTQRRVMNQGDILNSLNLNTAINVSKYDVKDIFVKNKLEYRTYRVNGVVRIGVELFVKPEFDEVKTDEVPF
jgi:predicted P-loop ATPase